VGEMGGVGSCVWLAADAPWYFFARLPGYPCPPPSLPHCATAAPARLPYCPAAIIAPLFCRAVALTPAALLPCRSGTWACTQ
jgi:hypothetical protein